MFGHIDKIDEMKEKINSVSPAFCLAKWMHCTIHLLTGHTQSCYLPATHKIPLEELKNNPSALHNTKYKKKMRRMMKDGCRPEECSICWDIEDLADDRYSDRHYRGVDDWTMPFFDKIKNMPIEEDVNPTYVEVSWSAACNFKCIYCSPAVSSAWMKEIKDHGAYELASYDYQSMDYFSYHELIPLDEENNPYIDAFWKWWPDLVPSLMYFRITGGEPLLSNHTYKVLEWLIDNPQQQLDLSINSNLGISEASFERFLSLVKSAVQEGKIKRHLLHTSLDTWGKQAEYIRHGINLKTFQNYIERYLSEVPEGQIAFMCTYNVLSVVNFREFLHWILELRKKYNNSYRQVLLDIPNLQGPAHFAANILTDDFHEIIEKDIQFMKEREGGAYGFKQAEIQKLERILSWMKAGPRGDEITFFRKDFYLFIKEHDKRRGCNFLDVFPEMHGFWDFCSRL